MYSNICPSNLPRIFPPAFAQTILIFTSHSGASATEREANIKFADAIIEVCDALAQTS
jgi:hypothetical protein